MFPKIAAVLGAHTELGKRVLSLLLRHPLIEKIHALADVDPRDDISLRQQDEHKLVLHLDSPDHVEETVSRYIPQCDIAFCVSGCGKKDMATMGAYRYHKTNLDIPRRFIHEMFSVGVERIALLSHAQASPSARGSEFLRVKGELEQILRELQMEAREHAPGATLFKVPLLLTNMKDASGVRGSSITKRDRATQTAAHKLELSPSQAVHVRDVAKAMVADVFYKLDMAEKSRNIEPRFRRRDIRYAEMDGKSIVELASQSREMHRETITRFRRELEYEERMSAYAQQKLASGSTAESSAMYSYTEDQSEASARHSESHLGRIVGTDSNESYMSGTPPEENATENEQEESFFSDPSQHEEGPLFMPGKDEAPLSPHPSPDPKRFDFEEGITPQGSATFHSPERGHGSRIPVTSVEALGQRLGRRLTVIRDNEYLPDVEDTPVPSFQDDHDYYTQSQRLSPRTGVSPLRLSERQYEDAYAAMSGDDISDMPSLKQPIRRYTNSFESPPSGPLSPEMQEESPIRRPERLLDGYGSPLQRYSSGTYDRPPSPTRRRPRSSEERYPVIYNRNGFPQRRSDYRGGVRSERSESRRSSLITRVTEFAERVISATDRPSMKRDYYDRGLSFRGRENYAADGSEEPILRGNGDMRPLGETTI